MKTQHITEEQRIARRLRQQKYYRAKKQKIMVIHEQIEVSTPEGLKSCTKKTSFTKEQIDIKFYDLYIKKPNYEKFQDAGPASIFDCIPETLKSLTILDDLDLYHNQLQCYVKTIFKRRWEHWDDQAGATITFEFSLIKEPTIIFLGKLMYYPTIECSYRAYNMDVESLVGKTFTGTKYTLAGKEFVEGEEYELDSVLPGQKLLFKKIKEGKRTPIPNAGTSLTLQLYYGPSYKIP